jgi:hypothetical protein
MRTALPGCALLLILLALISPSGADDKRPRPAWRALPLVKGDEVAPGWVQVGHGGFVVDDGALRTECDEKGMGLLLYQKEKFGDCQVRVVFKCKDEKSNSGVFVRIDKGILERLKEKPEAVKRGKDGKLSDGELKKLKAASEKGLGPWYAVHRGYEVQICDAGDEFHRTGSVYSLSKAAAPKKKATEWRTMVITLKGKLILVDLDGERLSEFDPDAKGVPKQKEWHEPKREHKRPHSGYLGLQNHDPGDVVYFKEVSVRSLADE